MKINFLTPDLWDACVDVTHRPQLPDSNRADYAGVDIGLKHDNAAIVVVSCTTSGVTLVSHRIRKPTSAQPLDLEQTIEAFLLDWHQRGWLVNCFIDPYQAHRSVITLKGQGGRHHGISAGRATEVLSGSYRDSAVFNHSTADESETFSFQIPLT